MKSSRFVTMLFVQLVVFVFCIPSFSTSADLKFQSDTIFRIFERDVRQNQKDDDKTVFPIYEYMQFDATNLGTQQLSFHGYGWGRYDFANSDFYDNNAGGEFLYGYLQYDGRFHDYMVRVGRQFIFPYVTDDAVDGALFQTAVTKYFTVTGFGGLPVALEETDGPSGDYTFGGRIANHFGNWYEIGAFFREVIGDSDRAEEEIGWDLFVFLPWGISIQGRSKYNLISDGWAEHAYTGLYRFWKAHLDVHFDYFSLENFLLKGEDSANPFRFLSDTDETILSYGGDLTFTFFPEVDVGARFNYYDYDKKDESAQFYSLLGVWRWEENSELGAELGYMNGDTGDNRYFLGRAYVYKTFEPGFVTADFVYADYNEDIMGVGQSYFASLGVGKTFLDADLAIKVSGDFSSDPYFDSDFRGMLNIRYNFGFSVPSEKSPKKSAEQKDLTKPYGK